MRVLWLLLLLPACHLLRMPAPDMPELSAGMHAGTLQVDGLTRRYQLYVPNKHIANPPLLVLLHGSRMTGEDLRRATGYAFDRLADEHGFVAVYPDGYKRRWNDCRAGGRYAARRLQLDDVGYVLQLVDGLQKSAGVDPARVFLAGYSGGGQLAFRVALEHPERVAGIAAFSANLPADENWACSAVGKPVPTLLINGTLDRINPYAGGRTSVFGFATRGNVRSARASAEYFAQLAGTKDFTRMRRGVSVDTWVEQWSAKGSAEVVLLAVHGGGHVVPGPSAAFPRILGKVSSVLDGPREVWSFFARQPSRTQAGGGISTQSPRP
ncbi:MAG: PHB depolymerase family esterase [Polyangiales bacterium]